MSGNVALDAEALGEEVQDKCREVETNTHGTFHFHTGRPLAARLGYDAAVVEALPDAAVESFAGSKPIVASTVAQGRACR
jgi:arsenite methyltransferase